MGFGKSGRLILILLLIPATLFCRGKRDEAPAQAQETVSRETVPSPGQDTPPDAPIAGGFQTIPLDSEYALKAAEEAKAVWSGEAKDWKTAVLLKAESQVVAGKNVRLTYENLPGFKGAVVFFPLNGGAPTVTWLE